MSYIVHIRCVPTLSKKEQPLSCEVSHLPSPAPLCVKTAAHRKSTEDPCPTGAARRQVGIARWGLTCMHVCQNGETGQSASSKYPTPPILIPPKTMPHQAPRSPPCGYHGAARSQWCTEVGLAGNHGLVAAPFEKLHLPSTSVNSRNRHTQNTGSRSVDNSVGSTPCLQP